MMEHAGVGIATSHLTWWHAGGGELEIVQADCMCHVLLPPEGHHALRPETREHHGGC